MKKEPTCNLGHNLPLTDVDLTRKNYQTFSIASDDSVSISSDLMGSTSLYIPSRYASISRRKASRQLTQAQEYFEYVCSDDNASVSSLPIPHSDCTSGRKLSHTYSLSKLSSVAPHTLASILEDYLAEEYEQSVGLSESYFLPRRTITKASKKWALLESTDDFEMTSETELEEKSMPRCLENKTDIFWF